MKLNIFQLSSKQSNDKIKASHQRIFSFDVEQKKTYEVKVVGLISLFDELYNNNNNNIYANSYFYPPMSTRVPTFKPDGTCTNPVSFPKSLCINLRTINNLVVPIWVLIFVVYINPGSCM